MNHEDNDSIAASRRSRGPKGLGEHAARAIEQSLGPSQGRGALEEESFLKDWLSEQGRLICEADWVSLKLISNSSAEHEVRYRESDHQKAHRSGGSQDGMIRIPGGVGDRGPDILGLQIGEILQDLLLRGPSGQHIQHVLHADTHPPDAGTATALSGIDRDALHKATTTPPCPTRQLQLNQGTR